MSPRSMITHAESCITATAGASTRAFRFSGLGMPSIVIFEDKDEHVIKGRNAAVVLVRHRRACRQGRSCGQRQEIFVHGNPSYVRNVHEGERENAPARRGDGYRSPGSARSPRSARFRLDAKYCAVLTILWRTDYTMRILQRQIG